MKTVHFPYIALALSAVIFLIVIQGSKLGTDGITLIPLLTLLIMSEFAFFVCIIGAYIGINQIRINGFQPIYSLVILLCVLFSIRFMLLGISLWPV